MAIIGEQLLQPESGWKRYDDTDLKIQYYNFNNAYTVQAGNYNNTMSYSSLSNAEIHFSFTGTKLRLITQINTSSRTPSLDIIVDGNIYLTTAHYGSLVYSGLFFELLDLPEGVHTAIIKRTSTDLGFIVLDAIDIDETGVLLYPYLTEKTKISEMEIGDVISCEYVAASNTVGTFSNLGNATKALIPPSSSATPDGSFYFIKVDENLLIADRVVQHSISWNTLFLAKAIENKLIGFNNIPTMTSNTTPSGIVEASSFLENYFPYEAFNDTLYAVGNTDYWHANASTGWISYEFTTPKIIKSYAIKGLTGVELRSPKIFTFEGWNGSEWTILDNRNIADSYSNMLYFITNNNTAYIKYRINVTQTFGEMLSIDKIEFYEEIFMVRTPSGGCSYIGANGLISSTNQNLGGFPSFNEWDRYIVNSDLNGKITKEDPNIWNHHRNIDTANGIPMSWCKDSVYNIGTNRITRGRFTQISISLNYSNLITNLDSTTINTGYGFRPVLQLIDNKQANFWR